MVSSQPSSVQQKRTYIERFKEQCKKASNLKSFLLETLKENKSGFLMGAGFTAVAGALGSAIPLLGERAINMIQNPDMAVTAAVAGGTIYAGASVLRNGLDRMGYMVSSWFYRRMQNRMSKEMLAKVFNIPPLVHLQKGAQHLSGLADTVATESKGMLQGIFDLAYFSPLVLASLGIVMQKAPHIAPYILGATAVKIAVASWTAKKLHPELEKLREKENTAKDNRQDTIQNYRFLQSHNKIDYATQENDKANQDILKTDQRLDTKWAIYDWLMRIIDVSMMYVLCKQTIPDLLKTHDAGIFMAVAGAAAAALGHSTTLAYLWREIKQHFFKYQDSINALQYDRAFELQKGNEKVDTVQGHIKFQDVSVSYPQEDKRVFEHMNLELKPGTLTVLAGESGVGKTTLIRLLQHMMEPEKGQITIDGHNVSKIRQCDLFKYIAIVHQEQKFLERKSILDNLRLVQPDISDEEIFHVMKELGLHDEIMKKKEGYQSLPQGLSGGQKQRLGIAQALLKNTPIVILDEPTANLDPANKALVYKKMKELSKDKTVIVISHNLIEMALSDRIVYMDKGKIVEDGSPAELIHNRGRFWNFYQQEKKALDAPFEALKTASIKAVKGGRS